jgi:hypothetical protein
MRHISFEVAHGTQGVRRAPQATDVKNPTQSRRKRALGKSEAHD